MKEDNTLKGPGNSYNFGAMMYDSRLGRWMRIDKHDWRFPGVNPYNFAFNIPTAFNDPDGKDGRLTIDYTNKTITLQTNAHLFGDL